MVVEAAACLGGHAVCGRRAGRCDERVRGSRSLTRFSHRWPDEVAHALVRRTRACRVETLLDTLVAYGQSVGTGRRHECRRGTHECVRHVITRSRPYRKFSTIMMLLRSEE